MHYKKCVALAVAALAIVRLQALYFVALESSRSLVLGVTSGAWIESVRELVVVVALGLAQVVMSPAPLLAKSCTKISHHSLSDLYSSCEPRQS